MRIVFAALFVLNAASEAVDLRAPRACVGTRAWRTGMDGIIYLVGLVVVVLAVLSFFGLR